MVEEGEKKDQIDFHAEVEKFKKMDPSKIGAQYDEVADKYEAYLEFMGYPDPEHVVTHIRDVCKIPKDALINDFGMGTGLVGDMLTKEGYTHIDGCDASEGLLEIARKKGTYKEAKYFYLVNDPLPAEWVGKYDVVCSAGLMTHDHIGAETIDEKIKALRPGGPGIFIFTTRVDYMDSQGYQKRLDDLVAEGKIEFVHSSTFTRYYNSKKEDAKDPRFLPAEVGCYTYRVKWA